MRALVVDTTEPAYNLALEETLFDGLRTGEEGLFLLWRNAPSIIVGRHQCTGEEINADFVQRRNIPVVRRNTGGGAVYHDLGNLNFSFIEHAAGEGKVDFARYLTPICAALRELGVEAHISGRNDLEVEGRKISGSAQRLQQGKVLHHGTLLVDLNFSDLVEALHVEPEKYLSKGVASVRARVANISEFCARGALMDELRAALVRTCADRQIEISPDIRQQAEELAETKYRTWEWNYGASPAFAFRRKERFPWGSVDLRLDVRKGLIVAARIHGDFFSAADVGELEQRLIGLRHEPASLAEALRDAPWTAWFSGCEPERMRDFFLQP